MRTYTRTYKEYDSVLDALADKIGCGHKLLKLLLGCTRQHYFYNRKVRKSIDSDDLRKIAIRFQLTPREIGEIVLGVKTGNYEDETLENAYCESE